MRQLRDEAPVYYNARRDLWVISRYADVQQCLRDHERLVNKFGNDIDGTHDTYGVGMLVCQDPPHHTVLRDAIRRCFGGREIMAMEAGMRETARRLVDDFKRSGSGDVIESIALPLAFDVALRLVGVPTSDAPFFTGHLLRAMERTVGKLGVPGDAAVANAESEERIAEVVQARREAIAAGADPDTPDAISQILLAVQDGTVADIETVGISHLVLSAATDAPAALLSNCLAMLDRYPSLQTELHEHPEKIAGFIEEVLRFDSPGQNLSRQTVAEVEVAGVTIPRDARVMLLLASGNRDERVFDSPDVFDIEREFTQDNKILAFGEGIHSCMGAPIARMAARVLLETMLDGTEYRVVGSPERWIKQMVRGFSYLPMEVVTGPDEKLTGAIDHHASKMTLTPQGTLVETRVVVAAKDLVSEGVVALTLEPADGLPLPEWTAGAHVDLVPDRSVMRQYSLCGDVHDRTKYRLGILREAGGRGGSLFVHDELAVGEELTVRGPRNNFELEPSPTYLFMAGGIGITPILPMIAAAEAAGAEWQLVYGGRTKASMAFLDELAVHGDKVRLVPQDTDGHLPLAELLGEAKDDTAIYVCGPAPLLDAVEAASAHWPEGALHLERFAAKTMTAPKRPGPFEVELAQTGVTLTVDDDTTVLEAVEGAGVQVLSSCREGTCGTCETPVLEGTPDHRDSVLGERAQKRGDCMMICVSRSCTDKLVLDL
ncbi:cytochrome P450/oxidoreductase [Nocardioides bruguierae]|uniref:Cytochrome P450/oxidoreductase n=1 Tax=Nocardioides bruguierae TaxID=2945102 RepID=A0A9X2II53_9ACTN|nr:cytochrome P450 [Nocardioides bruguierae]MCM0622465.1 cytochrome P450/oxidoreductase [Nocardioides bruguierae]